MCYNPVIIKVRSHREFEELKGERLHNKYMLDDSSFLFGNNDLDYYADYSDDNYRQYCILAPCGKCYQCLSHRKSMWTLRVIHEAQYNYADKGFLFVTLTYDEENNIDKSLDYSHIQKYFKRIRRNLP